MPIKRVLEEHDQIFQVFKSRITQKCFKMFEFVNQSTRIGDRSITTTVQSLSRSNLKYCKLLYASNLQDINTCCCGNM